MSFGLSANAVNATKNAAKGATRASKLAKASNTADLISLGGEVAAGVIGAVYAVKNEKRRQELVEQLQLLNAQQMDELNQRLSRRMSDVEKEQVLAQTLSQMLATRSGQQITSQITSTYTGESKSQTKMILYVFLGAIVLIGTIVAIKKLR